MLKSVEHDRVTSVVYGKQEQRFTMTGQSLPRDLYESGDIISESLTRRLISYGERRLKDAGFFEMTRGWDVEAYTMDHEDLVSDRSYTVRWINPQGGYIENIGMLLNDHYRPTVDHGFAIGVD